MGLGGASLFATATVLDWDALLIELVARENHKKDSPRPPSARIASQEYTGGHKHDGKSWSCLRVFCSCVVGGAGPQSAWWRALAALLHGCIDEACRRPLGIVRSRSCRVFCARWSGPVGQLCSGNGRCDSGRASVSLFLDNCVLHQDHPTHRASSSPCSIRVAFSVLFVLLRHF